MNDTLEIKVTDGIGTGDVMGGSPPPKQNSDRGPKPEDTVEQGKTMTEKLFEGIQLFARGPSFSFSACLKLS